MGTYLNPGKNAFEEAMKSDIFIDKTEMICYLNSVARTKQKYVSVSRPRRFGKTMAADMITAYYGREADSRHLFEKCKLSGIKSENGNLRWDEYLGQFDVIRLVMTDFFKKGAAIDKALDRLQKLVIRDLAKAYADVDFFDKEDLVQSLQDIYSEKKTQFVIVIDEWDAIFREYKEDGEGQKKYLGFLRDWLKDKEYIALAYMTGILPIKKYGKHSALNMFEEHSMTSPKGLAEYAGFTREDVLGICRQKGLRYEALREWYDGYRLSNTASEELVGEGRAEDGAGNRQVYEIYCPLSVVSAALHRRLENYWNRTENFEALAEYIRKDYDGLKDAVALLMDGGRLAIDTSTYQNDMTTFSGRDDVLSLLVHLGYLGYDDGAGEVFIPNKEILDEFRASTKTGEWAGTFESFRLSQEVLEATWAMDGGRVAELVERAHDRAANRSYNDEAALGYALQLAYYAAQKYYTIFPEADTGKGYADLVCIPGPRYPDKPALVAELKYNGDVEGAIGQIRRRDYPARLEHYKGNTLLVGINYNRDIPNDRPGFKHHSCVIEKA